MTHSLHRLGPKEDLQDDFVVMSMPSKGINDEGSAPKVKRHLALLNHHNPVNLGGLKVRNLYMKSAQEIIDGVPDAPSTFNGVFTNQGEITKILQELKEEELGLSVVISGLLETTKECCHKVGLQPHTANFSLGIWGKTEKLPEERVLSVTTMCGHGMVAANAVRAMVEDIKRGKDPRKAAEELARPCHCAIFNVVRAARILQEIADTGK